jgi:hypothetical protein
MFKWTVFQIINATLPPGSGSSSSHESGLRTQPMRIRSSKTLFGTSHTRMTAQRPALDYALNLFSSCRQAHPPSPHFEDAVS